jgi:A/G-specific adenine glycosylase
MTVTAKRSRAKRSEGPLPKRKASQLKAGAPDSGTKAGRIDASLLLAWYDRHRRMLPWRAGSGEAGDPYRVWLSEIMLQQTTVTAVAPYFKRFLHRFPDVRKLAAAPLEQVLKLWAGLGYYRRAHNLHACAQAVVERHGGHFPPAPAELAALPGIGRYTAAAIAAIAFDAPVVPVDGNIERVVARLFAVEQPLPTAKSTIHDLAQRLAPPARYGDFAQAMMDLGATICTPKKPACILCPWAACCAARAAGAPESFPRRQPKRTGELRRGAAYVLVRGHSDVLLRTRASKGLLGGMAEVPTSAWTRDFDFRDAVTLAPHFADHSLAWRRVPGVVTHVFTHFPLQLAVYVAEVPAGAPAFFDTRWVAISRLQGEALPTLMRKVLAHALESRPN